MVKRLSLGETEKGSQQKNSMKWYLKESVGVD